MNLNKTEYDPKLNSYEVVIAGGAMIGTAIAWFLISNRDFNGKILVVEKDPTLEFSSTSRTNNSIRQQFSNRLNIEISKFSSNYILNFKSYMENDERIPEIMFNKIGYLYLADDKKKINLLKKNQKLQNSLNIPTKIYDQNSLLEKFPYLNVKNLIGGSYNNYNEGYFDSNTIFSWWKKKAAEKGVEFIKNEVTEIALDSKKINAITLKDGSKLKIGSFVNATGTKASTFDKTHFLRIPVEPRKRYTFIFKTEAKINNSVPLIIDPTGIHFRSDGNYFLCGCAPEFDDTAAYDDFTIDYELWEEKIWPILANRIPDFERIKLVNAWAGHYAFNTFDQNGIIGPHPEFINFYFANGFSGHGLQQSPAVGRALSEKIIYKKYRTLNLKPLSPERLIEKKPFLEKAII